jgi:hypothetical protein
MNFGRLTKVVLALTSGHLGDDVVFISAIDPVEVHMKAIVKNETIEVDPNTGESILSDMVNIEFNSEDANATEGDIFIIEGARFVITYTKKDSFGSLKAILEKEEYAE